MDDSPPLRTATSRRPQIRPPASAGAWRTRTSSWVVIGVIPAFQTAANLLFHVPMTKSILITGGARSGKSIFAEGLALSLGRPALYIATAEARDDEMADRIARHRARRGTEWTTLAEPLALVETLEATDDGPPRLVDCLTLWLSNLMLADRDWEVAVTALTDLLPRLSSPVVMVTNEVGWGIVPDNALARAFRDAAGLANQRIAHACDELWLCVDPRGRARRR